MNKTIFTFERGAFFSGYLETHITKPNNQGDLVVLEMKGANAFAGLEQSFSMPETEMCRFEKIISKLTDWEKEYKNEDLIHDGYGWDITYVFNGISFSSGGYMSYPENYRTTVRELQQIIEELCEKYDNSHYDSKHRNARIDL